MISKTMNADRKNIVAQASTGMSLVELLVVLAIIAILAGTALVYINTDGYRLRAEANNLKSTLQEARMEAVKRNEGVKVVVYKDFYEVTTGSKQVFLHDEIIVYTGETEPEKFYDDTERDVSFTSLGTTNGLHVILGIKDSYYSICVNTVGRIWIMQNDIADRKPCSN